MKTLIRSLTLWLIARSLFVGRPAMAEADVILHHGKVVTVACSPAAPTCASPESFEISTAQCSINAAVVNKLNPPTKTTPCTDEASLRATVSSSGPENTTMEISGKRSFSRLAISVNLWAGQRFKTFFPIAEPRCTPIKRSEMPKPRNNSSASLLCFELM